MGTLYNACLESGAAYQRERDYLAAFRDYSAAANLQVADTATARQRMQAIGLLLTPTPTPTATPTPTPTPLPTVAAPPIPPTKLSSPRLKGMIVFRTNRDGSTGLYAMRPDGTHILEVADENATFEVVAANGQTLTLDYHQNGFEGLESLDAWTPDRRLRVSFRP